MTWCDKELPKVFACLSVSVSEVWARSHAPWHLACSATSWATSISYNFHTYHPLMILRHSFLMLSCCHLQRNSRGWLRYQTMKLTNSRGRNSCRKAVCTHILKMYTLKQLAISKAMEHRETVKPKCMVSVLSQGRSCQRTVALKNCRDGFCWENVNSQ